MANEAMTTDGGIYPRGFSPNMSWPWPLVKSKELILLNYGKALRDGDRRSGNVPVYGTNGQCGWHDRPLMTGPDVILGRKGQGPLGVEWCDSGFWVIDTAYFVTRKTNQLDLRYFYYLVKYIGLNHLKDGTSNPSLSRDTFADLLLPFPPLSTQRAIAHILCTLDDKIELNRRMSETLEAIAHAIFKSWFVDFNPVRAKTEGRDPGLPKHLADLFPARLMDSELGEIPEGWDVSTLATFASLNPESWTRANYPDSIAYVDLSNTKWGRIETITRYARRDVPSRAQRVLRPGDTIVGTVRPGNGSYALVLEEGLTGSTGFAVLRPVAPENVQFVCLAATARENIEALSRLADGGAYPAVRPEVVATMPAVRPHAKVLKHFSAATAPLLERMGRNESESRTLAALRDTLLPKLISGELRVKGAERFIEGHV
jgi:restriction endonuclease S subunit